MELVFDILCTREPIPDSSRRKVFGINGGVIGRQAGCDWVIPDTSNRLSKRHAEVSYREGTFWLTDISSNGTWAGRKSTRLHKGTAIAIEHDATFDLSGVVVQAQLLEAPAAFGMSVGWEHIPQQAHIGLDPLDVLEREQQSCPEMDRLLAPSRQATDCPQYADQARIDMRNLPVPQLVEAQPQPAPEPGHMSAQAQGEDFWERVSTALGVDLSGLEQGAREELVLSSARLLRLCVAGLQQSLRTRSDLKNELRLAQTSLQGVRKTPLQCAADASEALSLLLIPDAPGHKPAEQVITRAFRDLQAHQVAMLAASRAAMRSTLEHFSPRQLALRLERDGKPLFSTAGGRWRAYERYHQALCQDDDWVERLLARDFSAAYEEQNRLIATFHIGQQG